MSTLARSCNFADNEPQESAHLWEAPIAQPLEITQFSCVVQFGTLNA